MSKLHAIEKRRAISNKAIGNIREMADMCESGDVTEVAVVIRRHGGQVEHLYDCESLSSLVGSLEYLKQVVLREWIGNE